MACSILEGEKERDKRRIRNLPSCRMLNLELLQNSGTIIRDGNVTDLIDEHLVEPTGPNDDLTTLAMALAASSSGAHPAPFLVFRRFQDCHDYLFLLPSAFEFSSSSLFLLTLNAFLLRLSLSRP